MSKQDDIDLAKRRVNVLLAELEAEAEAAIQWWRDYKARRAGKPDKTEAA